MIMVIRRFAAAMFLAAMLVVFFASPMAQAKVCSSVTATNNLPCLINLTLVDSFGAPIVTPMAPGAVVVITFPAGFVLWGAQSAAGTNFRFTGGTPGCTPCFTLPGPLPTCCGTVCFDVFTCTVTVNPCPAPCLP